MRIKDSLEQHQYLAEAAQQGNLELIFSGLDVLGSTPWIVNKDVFCVVLDVWNSGDEIAGIPPANLDLSDPEKPADYDTNDITKKEYLQVLKETINKRRNNHSERCNVNYKLEIARAVSYGFNLYIFLPGSLTTRASLVSPGQVLLPSQLRLPRSGVPNPS